jgi:hypothetical protein
MAEENKGRVCVMGEMRNEYKVLVRKYEAKSAVTKETWSKEKVQLSQMTVLIFLMKGGKLGFSSRF